MTANRPVSRRPDLHSTIAIDVAASPDLVFSPRP